MIIFDDNDHDDAEFINLSIKFSHKNAFKKDRVKNGCLESLFSY